MYLLDREEVFQEVSHMNPNFIIPDVVDWDIVLGIDPGSIHMGISIIPSKHVDVNIWCCEITLPSIQDHLQSALQIQNCMDIALNFSGLDNYLTNSKLIIEGASYGEKFGQVKLAESRIAIALNYWYSSGSSLSTCTYLSPPYIRKLVFGNGKIIAKKLWKDVLLPDAADSLGCALAATQNFKKG